MIATKTESIGNKLESQLLRCARKKFTGRLDIKAATGEKWKLYLHLGRLVWANGGIHPIRRSHRLMSQYCQMISWDKISIQTTDRYESKDYHVLAVLAKRQVLSQKNTVEVIHVNITEVLFDILQKQELIARSALKLKTSKEKSMLMRFKYRSGARPSEELLLPSSYTLSVEKVLKKTILTWKQWTKAGLEAFSPNLAPFIKNPSLLEKQTSANIYKNLVKLINGKRTLRELAWITKQDLFKLTRSLLPFVRQKSVGLLQVLDMSQSRNQPPQINTESKPTPEPNTYSSRGLVACIDDNPQTCLVMKEILEAAGYRFLGIQQATQALPMLIQQKPDLIFLDLVMPVINGYELCSQLRKITRFQETPIIILTGSNSIVDRMRTKMAGATEFMTKPIDPYKIRTSLQRYLSIKVLDQSLLETSVPTHMEALE